MPECALGIQAMAIQPEPAIPGVDPRNVAMAILALASLISRKKEKNRASDR